MQGSIICNLTLFLIFIIGFSWAEDSPTSNETSSDFYEMLNVIRGASKKDIRKAFKKLALEKHPDKNKDNPEAHDIFVRINRAYSVLIDDTKRDVYDRLGHAGLDEHEKNGGGEGHPQYESWTFYQQSFGLYDDDPYVVTLSRSELERNIDPTRPGGGPFDPTWFIDFYSAHCSHCHDLAPHWKRLAHELRGVVHIGAVNCLEEWALCASQNLPAYPTLRLFPSSDTYPPPPDNVWDTHDLASFALARVPYHHVILAPATTSVADPDDEDDSRHSGESAPDVTRYDRNMLASVADLMRVTKTGVETSFYTFGSFQASLSSRRPWFVIFCHTTLNTDDVECPSDLSVRRMSRQLFGIVDVLVYRCRYRDHVYCRSHGAKLMYYPAGLSATDNLSQDGPTSIDIFETLPSSPNKKDTSTLLSPEVMEIVTEAMWAQVPDFPILGHPEMTSIFSGYRFNQNQQGDKDSLKPEMDIAMDLPLLSILLLDKVSGQFDQVTIRHLAQLKKLGSPLLASGDVSAISYFDCYTNLEHTRYCREILGITQPPSTKHGVAGDPDGPAIAFVLFKRAPPTSSLLPDSPSYEIYHGPILDGKEANSSISFAEIVAFVRQSATSSTMSLKPSDFSSTLSAAHTNMRESSGTTGTSYWLVDYFAPWCPPCLRLLPEMRKASFQLSSTFKPDALSTLDFGTIDCVEHKEFCTDVVSIKSFPSLHWYTIRGNDTILPLKPVQTSDGYQSSEAIIDLVMEGLEPSPIQILTPQTFKSEVLEGTQTKKIWFVDFGARWCGPCLQLEPVWRKFSKSVKGWAQVGTVDCGEYKEFCRSIGVRTFPRIRAYTNPTKFSDYPDQWWRDLNSIMTWGQQFMPSKVEVMDAKAIVSRVLHSRKPWIIDYYANWCGHCTIFAPEFDKLHERLGDMLSFGKMDCANQRQFCQDQKIPHYPTVRLYLGMDVYEDLESMTADELVPEVKRHLAQAFEDYKEKETKDEL